MVGLPVSHISGDQASSELLAVYVPFAQSTSVATRRHRKRLAADRLVVLAEKVLRVLRKAKLASSEG